MADREVKFSTLKVKSAMVEKGFTQEKLAKELNMTITTLNTKLNGKVDFRIREIERIASILDKEINYFFD